MASGHFLHLYRITYIPKRTWQSMPICTREVWVCFQRCHSQEGALCYVFREALGTFNCWIFEIRLLYSRCLYPAQPQGTDLCRYSGIQAGAELDQCPNTASSSSAAQQGQNQPKPLPPDSPVQQFETENGNLDQSLMCTEQAEQQRNQFWVS